MSLHPSGWLSSKQSSQASGSKVTPSPPGSSHQSTPTVSPLPPPPSPILKSSNPSTVTHHLHHQNILLYHPSPSPSQTHSFFIFISAPQLAPTPLLHTAHPHPPNFVARRSGGLPLTYVCATSCLADGTFIRWLIRWRVKRGLYACPVGRGNEVVGWWCDERRSRMGAKRSETDRKSVV